MSDFPPSNYRRCSRCHKVFKSRAGCDMHIQQKHAGNGTRIPVGESASRKPHEPSMAEMFIEAEMNRAMGIRNPDWIEEMLP